MYIYIVYISSDVSNTLHVPSTRKNMYFISCDLLAGGFNPSPASMLVTPTRSSSGIYRDIPKTSPWNKLILDTWIPTISGMYPFMYTYIYIHTYISFFISGDLFKGVWVSVAKSCYLMLFSFVNGVWNTRGMGLTRRNVLFFSIEHIVVSVLWDVGRVCWVEGYSAFF